MADTLDITAGAGTTIATDDVGGAHYQRIKLSDGTADATGVIAADIGVKANALRVCPASDITAATYIGNVVVTSGAITETNSGSIKTAVELIDNAISGTEMQVDVVAALPAGTNAIGKLAANTGVDIGDVDVLSIAAGDNNIGNVDIVTMPADTFAVDAQAYGKGVLCQGDDGTDRRAILVGTDGHVQVDVLSGGGGTEYTEDVATANPIVGLATMMERDDIIAALTPVEGDWASLRCSAEGALWVQDFNSDAILTAVQLIDNAVDGNYLNVNLNVAGTDAAAGEGVISAQTQRVTIATDDDGVAHLATLAGAVAATHMQCDIIAGTVTTVSTVTTLSQLGGQAISMGEGVVAAGCQRVTLATDDDGIAHLATIAGDTTAIETAIQIIDDWDATHAGAAVADGPQIMGAGYSTALPTDVGADADAARICTDRYGRVLAGLMPQWFNAVLDSADATAEGITVKAKTADRKIYIMSYIISSDVEGWIKLQKEDSTALTGKFWLKAGGGVSWTAPPNAPLVVDTVNVDLEVIAEAAGNISVTVTGYLAV